MNSDGFVEIKFWLTYCLLKLMRFCKWFTKRHFLDIVVFSAKGLERVQKRRGISPHTREARPLHTRGSRLQTFRVTQGSPYNSLRRAWNREIPWFLGIQENCENGGRNLNYVQNCVNWKTDQRQNGGKILFCSIMCSSCCSYSLVCVN